MDEKALSGAGKEYQRVLLNNLYAARALIREIRVEHGLKYSRCDCVACRRSENS